MKNILQFLLVYLIIVISISGFYYNVTSEHKHQFNINKSEIAGVEYLKNIYQLSISFISYKYLQHMEVEKKDINAAKKNLRSHVNHLLFLQKKYPEFKNQELNNLLSFKKIDSYNMKESTELLDYLNHENYRIGDLSNILFEGERKIYFLGSLITHYLPEYIISTTIKHNIVSSFSQNIAVNNFTKHLYTQQSKLVELSSEELGEIIKLLRPYKETKKLSTSIEKIQSELAKLSKYDYGAQNWQNNAMALDNYLTISHKILKLSHRLNNDNISILKSSLLEREKYLEEKISINRLLIIFILIVITLIIFYYYRAIEALQKEKKNTQDALEFKSKFLSNMSHEIRTPLNGIIGLTYVIQKTDLNEKQKHLVSKIKCTSDLLLNVINDILDISKIESGKMSIEKIPLNLIELVENLHSIFSIQTEEKKINFEIDYTNLQTPYLLGDSLRISQVLTNLLSNAVKFTSTGGVSLYIENRDNNLVRFSVKDSGIGLKPEQIEILFQEFTQADMSTSRQYGGTGLGLSIVQNLVELMGGEIWIESKFGVGSTFIFEIPLELSSSRVEKEFVEDEERLQERVNSIKEKKILVAEDNQMNQMLLQMLLEDTTLELEFAEDGNIAIDMFSKNSYDLIFMDLQMPNMNGYDATKAIRKIDSQIPIVALSANVMKEDIDEALKSGMNDYLSKPIDVDKLYAAILKYLN